MHPSTARITFRPLSESDLPMLENWLSRPHVAEWWSPTPTTAELEEEYGPALAGIGPTQCFMALADGVEIGFTQSYVAAECHQDGWWLDEDDPGVVGIDQFLADGDRLGQGLGTAMVSSFVKQLFEKPGVTRIQTDPDPSNGRAIRCYEKAGFRAVRKLTTLDGAALLMYCDRPGLR